MVAPYLGPLGALQRLRYPARGYAPRVDVGANVTKLLSGFTVVSRPAATPRTLEINYPILTDAERATLRALVRGFYGPPPYAYVDPVEANLLEANVADTGMALQSIRGWVVSGTGATLTRSAAGGSQGGGSMVWASGAVVSTKVLLMGVRAFPVLPVTQPITCSIWAKVAAGTLSVNLNIIWRDAAGTFISITTTTVTFTTTATRFSQANATPPGGAASGQFQLATATSSAFSATVDAPQAEYAAAASTYLPGQPGLAWVVPIEWDPSIVSTGLTAAKLVLQEVP